MPFSFTPTCALPPENTKFTSTPNVRGTLDIVWTCFSILLLCTWSVQHPNIQPQIKARTTAQYIRLAIFFVKRKAKWMLLTLVAPEILIGLALSQFVAARHGRDKMQELASEDGVEWTLEHSHFADMGGFVIAFSDASEARSSTGDSKLDTPSAAATEVSPTAGLDSTATEEDALTGHAMAPVDEAPSLRRAVNLFPRGVISVIRTPQDPRTEALSAPLSRGMTNKQSQCSQDLILCRNQRPPVASRPWNRSAAGTMGI
jgi:hypothetical protein